LLPAELNLAQPAGFVFGHQLPGFRATPAAPHFDYQCLLVHPATASRTPRIRGMRVTVGMIVGAMAAGRTIEQLLADFPYVEEADILEALAFAARLAQGHEVRLAS
jgi:uncharacterized protein (DUF433 family)